MTDFTGKPVAVGDIVVFNRPYYKDLYSSPVLKITPKGIKVKYKNNFGEYETFIAEGQFVVVESVEGGLVKQTNFERIKAMTVDEMAKLIVNMAHGIEYCECCPAKSYCQTVLLSCDDTIINWLTREVQEND